MHACTALNPTLTCMCTCMHASTHAQVGCMHANTLVCKLAMCTGWALWCRTRFSKWLVPTVCAWSVLVYLEGASASTCMTWTTPHLQTRQHEPAQQIRLPWVFDCHSYFVDVDIRIHYNRDSAYIPCILHTFCMTYKQNTCGHNSTRHDALFLCRWPQAHPSLSRASLTQSAQRQDPGKRFQCTIWMHGISSNLAVWVLPPQNLVFGLASLIMHAWVCFLPLQQMPCATNLMRTSKLGTRGLWGVKFNSAHEQP
jgi:hypothetical protein